MVARRVSPGHLIPYWAAAGVVYDMGTVLGRLLRFMASPQPTRLPRKRMAYPGYDLRLATRTCEVCVLHGRSTSGRTVLNSQRVTPPVAEHGRRQEFRATREQSQDAQPRPPSPVSMRQSLPAVPSHCGGRLESWLAWRVLGRWETAYAGAVLNDDDGFRNRAIGVGTRGWEERLRTGGRPMAR